jgi:hypothetical protein
VVVEVRRTPIAKAQVVGLRGPNLKAFDRFVADLAERGCAALQYRVTGDHLDKLCVRHLRGEWRVVVAFHPNENTAWVVLVAEHVEDDPGRNVYELLYEIVGHRPPADQRRRKPPCCDDAGAAPDATDQMAELLAARTRDVLRSRRQ